MQENHNKGKLFKPDHMNSGFQEKFRKREKLEAFL
jgi:hypothetical protein